MLIHIFDGYEWTAAADQGGATSYWRARPRQTSATLLFADMKPPCCANVPISVYKGGRHGIQGIVFRPGVTTRIICGAATDMSGRTCEEDTKWCDSIPLAGDNYDYGRFHSASDADGCGKMWRPSDFGVYLKRTATWQREAQAPYSHRQDYNEILVDGRHWASRLPDVIEAFFGDTHATLAKEQHALFLREYGLSSDDVPLLRFDEHDWRNPFQLWNS